MKTLNVVLLITCVLIGSCWVLVSSCSDTASERYNSVAQFNQEMYVLDISSSTTMRGIKQADSEFLRSVIEHRLAAGNLSLGVIIVSGNPHPQLYRLDLRHIYNPDPDSMEIPQFKDSIERKIQLLKQRQQSLIENFINQCMKETDKINSPDVSYVFPALESALIFLSEPQYDSYKKRIILLTDCLQDPSDPNRKLTVPIPNNLDVLNIGCEPRLLKELGFTNIIPLENVDGVKSYLLTLNSFNNENF